MAEVHFPFGPQPTPHAAAMAFIRDEGCVNSAGVALRFGWTLAAALAVLKRLERVGLIRRKGLRGLGYGGAAYDWEAVELTKEPE